MPITNDMFDKHDIRFMTVMRENPETTVQYMVNFIITDCLFDLIQSPFFLPANRIFFPAYFKYIYSTEAKEFQNVRRHLRESKSIDTDSISEYPHTEPVNHLIEAVANLPRREANDYYLDLLEELEQIISGKITFSQKEGIAPVEFKLKPNKGESIDMYLASSSSNQLTMLYLYFKYWARKSYNFLIIDEPEENLHPQNQIKIANILLKFANRDNNKVLITTHSPLLAETINNDMYMSYIKEHQPEETVSKLADDYVIENTLKSEDYGVYFFDGGRTTQYKADSYGIYFKDFAQEETKVREHSDALRARIYTIQNDKQYHD